MPPSLKVVAILAVAASACSTAPIDEAIRLNRVDVLRDSASYGTGPLQLTGSDFSVDTLDVAAYRAWRVAGGHELAWSGLDGAGGFENEGQSLTLVPFDAPTEPRWTTREYTMIESVSDGSTPDGQRLLIIGLRDGGAGFPHLAIADPNRGVVLRATNATAEMAGDSVRVLLFDNAEPESVRKIETHAVADLLQRELLPPLKRSPM